MEHNPKLPSIVHSRRCILPLVRARQNGAHCPPPLILSLEMSGGKRRGAHTNAYYNQHGGDTWRQKTLTAHHPDTTTRNARNGSENRMQQKTRQNTATSPKAAAKAAASSTPSKSTGQQTQHSLKKEQRPKSCCRTTTAVKRVPLNRRSKGLQPEDPSKACETCGPVRKKASKTRGRSVVVSTPGAIARVKLRRGCSQPTTHVREGIPEESRSSRSIKNIA